jgi:sec-independent protein translocase protein TatC
MSDAPESTPAMTLVDHLAELRTRIVRSAWAIAATTLLCWAFSDFIVDAVTQPIRPYVPGGKLVFLHPVDMFVAHIKISFVSGLILACPIWFLQLWKFVAPGLHPHERRYSAGFILAGVVLFLTGTAFAYFLVIPGALKFLLTFGNSIGQPLISVADYMSFFTTMLLVFGASFELPLIIVILGLLGVVDQRFLREKRRYAIVILSILAAIITPPDVLSMLMLLIPLVGLYEASILILGVMTRRRSEGQ